MDCVIFDIDGTLAHFDAPRLGHLVHGETKHWDEFHTEMATAPVIEAVARLLKKLHTGGEKIVLCSGRPVGWQQQTEAWLQLKNIPFDGIFLRHEQDNHLSDPDVKQKLLNEIRAAGFNPWIVVDDRTAVVQFWREAGLVCLQCAQGDF
ncbi:HAD family acid phosphatase [Kiloniella majae]|uniref:phosphatase domain-containing protein n=1 Tax=Kiloniella majae TaxID=1938558 RepID=UPI000A2771FF|nr:HAD family acid phosphatase [Kiloniella majae]